MFQLIARLEALEAATAIYAKEDRVVVNAGTIHDPEYRVGTVVQIRAGEYYVKLDDDTLDKNTTPARGLRFKIGADHDNGGIIGIFINGSRVHKAKISSARLQRAVKAGGAFHGVGDKKNHRGKSGLMVGDRIVADIGGRNNSLEPLYYLGTIASLRGDYAMVDFDEGHKTKFEAVIGTRGILGVTESEIVTPLQLTENQVKKLIKGFVPHDFGERKSATVSKGLKKGMYVIANFSHAQSGEVDDRYYAARVEHVSSDGYASLRYMDNDRDVIAAKYAHRGILGPVKAGAKLQKAPIKYSLLGRFLEDEYIPKPSEHLGDDKPISNAKYVKMFKGGAPVVAPAAAPAARKPAAAPAARKPAARKPAARNKGVLQTKDSYEKGDRILGLFEQGGYLYMGHVSSVSARSNTVTVLYDDGDDATYDNVTVSATGSEEGIVGLTRHAKDANAAIDPNDPAATAKYY